MTARKTPGQRLRAAWLAECDRAAAERNVESLVFDEHESRVLADACDTADRIDQLRAALAAEVGGESRPSILHRLNAEIRAQERHLHGMTQVLRDGLAPARGAVAARAAAAARSRWSQREAGM